MAPKVNVSLDLSVGQYTTFGKILYKWYYSSKYKDLRALLESLENPHGNGHKPTCGYPHNGGSHSLAIFLSRKDMITFLELAIETEEILAPFFKPILNTILNKPETGAFRADSIWRDLDLNKNEYAEATA